LYRLTQAAPSFTAYGLESGITDSSLLFLKSDLTVVICGLFTTAIFITAVFITAMAMRANEAFSSPLTQY
jgi:hypothetical protein